MNNYINTPSLRFIPLKYRTKQPLQTGWQNRGVEWNALSAFGAIPNIINVGILTGVASGGLIDIDLDGPFTIEAGALLLPFTGMVMGRDSRPGSHWFYLLEGCTTTVKLQHPITGKMLVEFRGDGCQTMMIGSIHPDDGRTVRFESGKDCEPSRADRTELLTIVRYIATVSLLMPYWTETGRHQLAMWFAGLCATNGISRNACETVVRTVCDLSDDSELEDRLTAIQTTYDRFDAKRSVEWKADLTKLFGSDKAINTIVDWMGGSIGYRGEVVTHDVTTFHENRNNIRSTKLDTDVAIAEWFKLVTGDRLIFSDRENQFYKSINGVYEPITATEAKGEVTEFLKGPNCSSERHDPDKQRSLQSVSKINATYEISKSLLRIDDRLFDRDDHLLGTENGIFDLSSFRLIHSNNYVTKRIGTRYIADVDCPLFLKFINQVMDGDQDKIDYLQRAVGYTLTGSVEAQVMFILTGNGANGKSVFLKLLSSLMGSYGGAVPAHTITQQKFGNDRTDDLASLTGKRFVVASEGDAGDKLAVAKIKRMVAGDPIAVRRLYGSYFDLQPKFKLWFGSNDLPQVNGTDYAIWRRIHVIQFPVTFQPHERDPKLLEQLKTELPGIFNWALEGLRKIGEMNGDFLAPPSSVLASVEEYRAENDNVSKFIDDRCIKDPSSLINMGELHESYKQWCYHNAVEPMNNNMLGKDLTNLGFPVVKRNTGNARRGIKLK